MGWLDLHMHSNRSNDGEFSPKQLMNMCKESGLKVVALTDHNSVRGVKEAEEYAAEYNMMLIKAVELDCSYQDIELHILGYGIDVRYKDYEKIELDILKQEQRTSEKRMDLIKGMGIAFDRDELMKLSRDSIITGEMIAEVALKDDRNKDNLLMAPYYDGGERSDNPFVNFYWDLCSKGKVAYVPIEYISLPEAIHLIVSTGGVPVLAHPGINVKEKDKLLQDIIEEGIKGLEVYSSYHTVEQTKYYENVANQYGLIKTIGSDFHGKIKPSVQLGGVYCNDSEEKIYQEFMHLVRNRNKNKNRNKK